MAPQLCAEPESIWRMELRRQCTVEPVVAASESDLVEFLDHGHPFLVFRGDRQREPDAWWSADAPRSRKTRTSGGFKSGCAANAPEGRRLLFDATGRWFCALLVRRGGRAPQPSLANVDFADSGTRSRQQTIRDDP